MSETTKLIKYVVFFSLLVGAVSIISVGLGIITLPWHTVTAQVDSGHEIIEQTYEADNAIYNYEWFKTQYEDIKAQERKIQTTKNQIDEFKSVYGTNMSEWDTPTKQTYSQLQTTYTGQKGYYENLVADYNARSQMANRNIFKDGLPMSVDKMMW